MITLLNEISAAMKLQRNGRPVLEGWCDEAKAHLLAATIVVNRIETVVEIGVFGGRSLIPMAMALRYQDLGMATGIDPWTVDAAVVGMDPANANWWRTVPDLREIRRGCLNATEEFNVARRTQFYCQSSNDVKPPANIGLLHVDGNHSEQALTDVQRFAPNVIVGGYVCSDDIGWSGGGVAKSVDWLLGHGFRRIQDIGTGALFQRINDQAEARRD